MPFFPPEALFLNAESALDNGWIAVFVILQQCGEKSAITICLNSS